MPNEVARRSITDASLEARAADDSRPPQLVGYASVFGQWTTLAQSPSLVVREMIMPGAFRNVIVQQQDVRMLVDHDSSLILGRTRAGTLRLAEDGVGLWFECDLPDTQLARDVAENVRQGNISQCSFSFLPPPGGEKITSRQDGSVTYQDIQVTDAGRVFDTAVVTFPAYEGTSVSLRAQRLIDAHAARQRLVASRRRLNRLRLARAAGVSDID
jgi:HK97 family phage prohead protease